MNFVKDRPTSPNLYGTLCADLAVLRVRHAGRLWMLYYALVIPGFRTVLFYRLSSHFYKGNGVSLHFGRFLWQLNMLLSSCEIAPEARIGAGLFLPHPIGIVIGAARIGENAKIMQNTTIGIRDAGEGLSEEEYPLLGDNVFVAAGAVLLGKIRIGNNAVIGANAVVLKDVPDNSTAVGVPARILPHE